MSGTAGEIELFPPSFKKFFPAAPSSGPSRPTRPTWVAKVPTVEGLEAMKKCEDKVQRMRAADRAKIRGRDSKLKGVVKVGKKRREDRFLDKSLSKTMYKLDLVSVSAREKQSKASDESEATKADMETK